jgi:predicted O-linked N-acetylglucosamine transferase (SPINDLY family)
MATEDIVSSQPPFSQLMSKADDCFEQEKYEQAAELYEQLLATDATVMSLYWKLGLSLLLQGEEEAAQMAWMTPLMDAASEDQALLWTGELVQLLKKVADQQAEKRPEKAWAIRQYIYQFTPEDLNNSIQLIQLGIQVHLFEYDDGLLPQLNQVLESKDLETIIDSSDLLLLAKTLLDWNPGHPDVLKLLDNCVPYLSYPDGLEKLVVTIMAKAIEAYESSKYEIAAPLGRICARLAPNNFHVIHKAIQFLQRGDQECLLLSIELSERHIQTVTDLTSKAVAIQSLITALLTVCNQWERAVENFKIYKSLLEQLAQQTTEQANQFLRSIEDLEQSSNVDNAELGLQFRLLATGAMLFYFEDEPRQHRSLRNAIAKTAIEHMHSFVDEKYWQKFAQSSQRKGSRNPQTNPLKIGYLSSSFRKHSVGWLARWLLHHHDREQFDVHLYSHRAADDHLYHWFAHEYGDRFHPLAASLVDIAEKIHDDEIDILIELDSLTDFNGCAVMAMKPAPIQLHWLGYDSSGLPTVDYFLADSYVLPPEADDYYCEKIWRLPNTYIAVDGFEVATPSLRREDLNISDQSVVFLSSQTGLKRNPDNVRIQMSIVKEVPNSIFLVKSFRANPQFLEEFFYQIAEEEGLSRDRIRFLPDVPFEGVHRANLTVADVVLDTYPYNGATTTLEALWMGLPIVTQVGQQFAARNSYTMLMNAGVTEGIAWTASEYIEWGIRLGTDATLRDRISQRLWHSRRTAPLWNTRQFARDVESAYLQMWNRHN